MIKKKRFGFQVLFLLLLVIFLSGCNLLKKDGDGAKFEKGSAGLVMNFVQNYPQDKYLVSDSSEEISIVIDVRNKGTHSIGKGLSEDEMLEDFMLFIKNSDPYAAEQFPEIAESDGKSLKQVYKEQFQGVRQDLYETHFERFGGQIYISGFDDRIIQIGKLENGVFIEDLNEKSKSLSGLFLPSASVINPRGGFDTVEFEGKIISQRIEVDSYDPVILVTACYPYSTKASPTICIDPLPFEHREEKVCEIGSVDLSSQGAPVAITKVEQEATTGRIQFKIHIKNVGDGDVLKPGTDVRGIEILNKCSPLGGGVLDRKDFDRVQIESIRIGLVDMLKTGKCGPFADGTNNIVRLFNEEVFVICTLDVSDLGNIQSSYTTPLNIELRYAYRSSISKQIEIKKLTTLPTTPTGPGPTSTPTPELPGVILPEDIDCPVPIISSDTGERCQSVTYSTIAFNWESVEGVEVEEYGVEWCPKGTDLSDESCGLGYTSNNFIVATELDPDTSYNFRVFLNKFDESTCGEVPNSEEGSCNTLGVDGSIVSECGKEGLKCCPVVAFGDTLCPGGSNLVCDSTSSLCVASV